MPSPNQSSWGRRSAHSPSARPRIGEDGQLLLTVASPRNLRMRTTIVRARMAWHQKILLKLFRPRPPRPKRGEASEAEIASVIIQFVRAADRANGLMGKDNLLSFIRHLQLGPVGATTDFGRWSCYFEPEAPPLAPDFRFDFEEDHEGTITFCVLGDYRYEGFLLTGQLTKPGATNSRQNWPAPRLSVSAEPRMNSPVTRHAKRLRDFFIRNYEAKDYHSIFKSRS